MTIEELIAKFPRLFHMAEGGSWDNIRSHGLLSTKKLVELFGCDDETKETLVSAHRPQSVDISNGTLGPAVVRDQKPMGDSGLERCLEDGLTPADWYRILNSKCFFWTSEDRLLRLLNARPYRDKEHDVLIVATAPLIAEYSNATTLCPMNSGCTRPFAHPRGSKTFLPIEQYDFQHWRNKGRPVWDSVVEVAIDGGVKNVADFVMKVERRRGSEILDIIWES